MNDNTPPSFRRKSAPGGRLEPAPASSPRRSLGAARQVTDAEWSADKENGGSALWETDLEEPTTATGPENLAATRVYVRVRPFQRRGSASDSQRALSISAGPRGVPNTLTLSSGLGPDGTPGAAVRYSCHRAFETESHDELAAAVGSPLVESVLNGYNGAR